MTDDDVLFRFRLQVMAYAAEHGVSAACRVFGVHRSTYYVWKHRAERQGLEMLRPRERRRPRMPNQFSGIIEQRILALSVSPRIIDARQAARTCCRLPGTVCAAAGSRARATYRCHQTRRTRRNRLLFRGTPARHP